MYKALKLLGVLLVSISLLLPAVGFSAEKAVLKKAVSRSPTSVLTSEALRNPVSDRLIVEQAGPVVHQVQTIIPQVGPVRLDPMGTFPRSLSGTFSRLDNLRAF